MSNKIKIAIAGILSAFLLLPCIPRITAHANSAQTWWRGQDAFGACVMDENCPVVVDKEILTLNISNFPGNYYTNLEDLESYDASVTAEYTFRNPADYDVDMTLAFPFGELPYYYGYYDPETGEHVDYDDTARYKITADGDEICRNLRYTLNSWKFDPAVDIARLASEKRTCDFITPETLVTTYTFELNPDTSKVVQCVGANFYGLGDTSKTRILFNEFSMANYGNKKEQCGTWIRNDRLLTMYVIGEPLKKMPDWKFYVNGGMNKEVAGSIKLSTKLPPATVTFNEFALTYFDNEGAVGEVDWYNAVLDAFTEDLQENRMVLKASYSTLNVATNLMRWYEYNLSIPAGKSLVNSVTAPLYPDIDAGWEPAKYSYTYLLSPASTWADFGSFEARINTPYFLVDSSLSFERHEAADEESGNFYTFTRQGLPKGELNFTLSTDKSPQYKRQPIGKSIGYFLLYIGIPIVFAVVGATVVAAIVLLIIFLVRRRRRIKRQQ